MAPENDTRHRREVVQGLRDLADWLEATPDAPVPTPTAGVHVERAAFDMLPELGLGPIETDRYVARGRHFGPIHYWVQTNTVKAVRVAGAERGDGVRGGEAKAA